MGQKTNSTITSLSVKNAKWKSRYIEKNLEESSILLHKNVEIKDYLNKVFKSYGLIIHNSVIEYNQNTANFFITFFEKKPETSKFCGQHNKLYSNIKSSKTLIEHIVNNVLKVDLNLFLNNKRVTFKIRNLNQKFEFLINGSKLRLFQHKNILRQSKRFLKDPLFKELIKILFVAVTEKNSAKLIAESISRYFIKQKKRHGFLLFLLKKTLTNLISSDFSVIKGIKIVINGRFNGAPRSNKKILNVNSVPLQSFDSSIDYYESTAYTLNGTFGIKVWVCEKN